MDSLQITLALLSFAAAAFLFYLKKPNPNRSTSAKLPPGPKAYPVIGNILDIGQKPHESLAKLSKTYGPLMSLKLGSISTVVVSSPEVAKIILQKHDQTFSSRTHPNSMRALDHHKFSVAWMPVDDKWRQLRRIWKEQMFSASRLDASQGMRMEKLQNLRDYLYKCCANGQVVDIGHAAFATSLSLMSTTLFSKDFGVIGSESSHELRDVMCNIMVVAGKTNLSDTFPILRLADPQGIFRAMTVNFQKCFTRFDEIINQRLRADDDDHKPINDILEVLLDLKEKKQNELSFDDIKHLLLDLFVGGTETTSTAVEWAMAELIRNPDKMLRAKTEIDNAIPKNEQVQESDFSRLPYLRAVIKETFRLHPALPLLLPHKATKDIEISGYLVSKDTQIIVNVWAIGRDSSAWLDPELFMPERFLGQETDFWGRHFELIPFGAGRRMCAGLALATRMVHLMVATLIHGIDWKLEKGLQQEELDMRERSGISLQKAIPLKAIPSWPQ